MENLTPAQKGFSVFAVFSYWFLYGYHSGIQFEQLFFGGLALALLFASSRISNWRHLILPLVLTAIVYDSQRHYSDLLRGPIHVLEPYAFDLRLFGIREDGVVFTPNEWLHKHGTPFLDVFSGFAYLLFIPEFFLVAGFFIFSGNERVSRLAREMCWGFLWLNVLGYSTYYWYAAAPPWYVADYGLVPADLSVKASLAGCRRFEEFFGVPGFKNWYGHSADVYGSIP